LLSRLQTTPAGAHLLSSQRCGGFFAGDLPFIPVWSSTRNMAAPPIPSRWNMVFTVDTAVHRGYCTHGPCFHFRLTDWTVGSMVIPRKIRFHRFVTSTIEGSAVLIPNFVWISTLIGCVVNPSFWANDPQSYFHRSWQEGSIITLIKACTFLSYSRCVRQMGNHVIFQGCKFFGIAAKRSLGLTHFIGPDVPVWFGGFCCVVRSFVLSFSLLFYSFDSRRRQVSECCVPD
jgi:hypothetical protein